MDASTNRLRIYHKRLICKTRKFPEMLDMFLILPSAWTTIELNDRFHNICLRTNIYQLYIYPSHQQMYQQMKTLKLIQMP